MAAAADRSTNLNYRIKTIPLSVFAALIIDENNYRAIKKEGDFNEP